MKKFNFKINGNEYQTTVEQNGELLQVTVNGKSYAAELLQDEAAPKPVAAAPKAAAAAAPAAAAAAPKAPTGAGNAGTVTKILVSNGQSVQSGDPLVEIA